MKCGLNLLVGIVWLVASCGVAHADLIQVASGGITTPSGSESRIDVVLNTTAFASVGLWDAVSGTVGGGAVDGHLYYAFIARPLDREGDGAHIPNPPGRFGGLSFPSNARGGGVISRGATDLLGVGDNLDAYAYSTFGTLTNGDLSNRLDLSPNLPVTFLVHVNFDPGANDAVTVTGTIPYHTTEHKRTASGDASFDLFRFMSDASNNRWEFSSVAFATTAEEALAAIPEPSALMLALVAFAMLACTRRRR
ncbi:MAG: hypothetical protein U1E05_09980 [Patescibacteria group bacterium]|nr:hypothetical protein [Patescibacteria group bacterium]